MKIKSEMRVEIAPHYDLWMRGARFGVVRKVYTDARGVEMVAVRMDNPQVRKLARMPAHDVSPLSWKVP